MEVAILCCRDCCFSTTAESHLKQLFSRLGGGSDHHQEEAKIDIKLESYDLSDIEASKTATHVHGSKIQLLIISHQFLAKLSAEVTRRVRLPPLGRILRSKRVIAVLVGGLKTEEVKEGYEDGKFEDWFSLELGSTSRLDPDFVDAFRAQVLKIYNLEARNISHFTVFPKKISRDAPKVVILLKSPLQGEEQVSVLFSCGRTRGEGAAYLKAENPFTLSVKVPEGVCPSKKTGYVEVAVLKNGAKLGSSCIKIEGGEEGDGDGILDRLPPLLPGFLKLLDDHLRLGLVRNYEEGSDPRLDPDLELMNDALICKGDEFPTPLHFCAFYGLENSAFVLLDEGDGMEMVKIPNDCGLSPLDLAELGGHEGVLQTIKDFQFHQEIGASLKIFNDYCGRQSIIILEKEKIVTEKSSAFVSVEETTPAETPPTDTPIQKPKPAARSPRCKERKSYCNVEPFIFDVCSTASSAPTTPTPPPPPIVLEDYVEKAEVKLRERESVRRAEDDRRRRVSISPIQNMFQAYDVPPSGIPIPVAEAVFTARGDGSSLRVDDGYIYMGEEEYVNAVREVQHVTFKAGEFVAVEKPLFPGQAQQEPPPPPSTTKSMDVDKVLDSGDQELIRIMKECAATPSNLTQIDKVLENWKKRPDVKKSIEEKKDYMKKLREEYSKMNIGGGGSPKSSPSLLKKLKSLTGGRNKKTSVTSPPLPPQRSPSEGGEGVRKMSRKFSLKGGIGLLSRPSVEVDQESLGSHGSESGGSGNSSTGVSELEPETKQKDTSKSPGGSPKWTNPRSMRFIPSYVPHNPPPGPPEPEEEEVPEYIEPHYEVPPIPRPVVVVVSSEGPLPPAKPSRNKKPSLPDLGISVSQRPPPPPPVEDSSSDSSPPPLPPQIPRKSSQVRAKALNVEEETWGEVAPPPPPRTYNQSKPFNYVDYSQRNKPGSNNVHPSSNYKNQQNASAGSMDAPASPMIRSPSPYDNLRRKDDDDDDDDVTNRS